MIMKNFIIKIVFSNKYEENALSFDEFENAIVDAIKDCKKNFFSCFLKESNASIRIQLSC